MQYIGDVKAGTFMGSDRCVSFGVSRYISSGKRFVFVFLTSDVVHRFGNRYFENLNAEQEVPGTSTLYV